MLLMICSLTQPSLSLPSKAAESQQFFSFPISLCSSPNHCATQTSKTVIKLRITQVTASYVPGSLKRFTEVLSLTNGDYLSIQKHLLPLFLNKFIPLLGLPSLLQMLNFCMVHATEVTSSNTGQRGNCHSSLLFFSRYGNYLTLQEIHDL